MRDAFLYIISMSALFTFASMLSYSRYDRRSTRFALGIILLSSMINPFTALISGIVNTDFAHLGDEAVGEGGDYNAYVESAYVLGIERAVADKFSIDADRVKVKITGFNIENGTCTACVITVKESALLHDYRAIREYVKSMGASECEVIFSG